MTGSERGSFEYAVGMGQGKERTSEIS